MLGPQKLWLFTGEDIPDFWLSTWEDMVIYGNITNIISTRVIQDVLHKHHYIYI